MTARAAKCVLAAVIAAFACGQAVPAAPRVVGAAAEAPTTEQLQQKLRFARMLTEQSKLAYRLDHGGDHARAQLVKARGDVKDAAAALQAGRLEDAAAAADKALEIMTAAAHLLPANSPADDRLRYKELTDAVSTYKDAYDRNFKRLVAAKGESAVGTPLDEHEFDRLVADAGTSAGKGDLAGADRVLETAQRRITKALTVLLKGQTIVYNKTFSSPAQEFHYEAARHKSYADLVPKAIAQHSPTPHAVEMIHRFVGQSASMKDKADRQAQAGDYKTAIATLQQATSQLKRALWIAGVRWGQWPERETADR